MENDIMRIAPEINLTEEERQRLGRTVRIPKSQARDVFRARIILLAEQNFSNPSIAEKLNTSANTAGKWRRRFVESGIAGLADSPRSGRNRSYTDHRVEEVVKITIEQKPENATHWSTRTMAKQLGISRDAVSRIWRANGLKPHLTRTFKLSNDKNFTQKLRDVVGLYMNPPENAMVFSVDEKSQIQALDRTQPGLPLKKGRCNTMTHDYVRHGTCTLFAAMNVLTGQVLSKNENRHRHQEYLRFLRLIDRSTPKKLDLHLIVDNYCTHKHKNVKAWLEKHPRFHIHFIPTSSSWLNIVERFFGKITQERIRRGVFKSVLQLVDAIDDYITKYNRSAEPFVWKKTAEQIIKKVAPIYEMQNKTMN